MKLNPDKQQLTSKQVARRWPYLSLESWITLIYQMLKIFMLNRITPKSFKQLPGIPQSLASVTPDIISSNIFGISEMIILKWLSYHFAKIYPEIARPVRNFDKDLTDGIVLASVIISHVGQLKSLTNLKINAVTKD